MGESLDWYRREICQREGHTHGEAGELECILLRLAEIRAQQRDTTAPVKSDHGDAGQAHVHA